ncbi:Hypothetical predicted protein, partial [Paramuricea clavata]
MGETGCGKTRLIRFMCELQAGPDGPKNLLLMKVHGGTSYAEIEKKVKDAEKLASCNEKINVDTILFFDEANTTDAIDLIKEIMVDRRVNGRAIDPELTKLHFIAACNPYRKHTKEMIQKLESAGLGYHVSADETEDKLGSIPLRQLVYRVHPLPESMRPLVWDFGQLTDHTEELYTAQIVRRFMVSPTPDSKVRQMMPACSSSIYLERNKPILGELNMVYGQSSGGRPESHGLKYLAARVKRYPNSTSTFQLTRIAISGDVSPNNGPSVKCKVCLRTIARNHRAAVVMLDDLNHDRLRPDRAEGKLLIDVEETHGFVCLITQPTRIQTRGTKTTKTLIDVILTNQPHLFIHSGVYDPGLSDHPLVYGFMQEKVPKCKARVIKFRSAKNLNEDDFKNHLRCAPWHVGEVFDDVEDQMRYIRDLYISRDNQTTKTVPETRGTTKRQLRSTRKMINLKKKIIGRYELQESAIMASKWDHITTKLQGSDTRMLLEWAKLPTLLNRRLQDIATIIFNTVNYGYGCCTPPPPASFNVVQIYEFLLYKKNTWVILKLQLDWFKLLSRAFVKRMEQNINKAPGFKHIRTCSRHVRGKWRGTACQIFTCKKNDSNAFKFTYFRISSFPGIDNNFEKYIVAHSVTVGKMFILQPTLQYYCLFHASLRFPRRSAFLSFPCRSSFGSISFQL